MRPGMDPAVHDQRLERAARDLAPDRVEAGDDHGVGRVVDDDVHPGRRLERADVPPLAPDDAPLHLVARQRHGRHGRLGGVLGGDALGRHGDDAARLPVGTLPRLFLDVARQGLGRAARLVFHPLQQLLPGIGGRQAGDLLELRLLLRRKPRRLLLPAGNLLVARVELLDPLAQFLLLGVELRLAPLERLVALLDPALQPPDLLPPAQQLLLQRLANLHRLHLGSEHGLGAGAFHALRGVGPDARGLGARLGEDARGGLLLRSGCRQKASRPRRSGRP